MLSALANNNIKTSGIVLVIFGIIILLQFIWLFFRAIKQQNMHKKDAKGEKRLRERLDSILDTKSNSVTKSELRRLKGALGSNQLYYDIFSEVIFDYMKRFNELSESQKRLIAQIIDSANPIIFYKHKLKSGKAYDRAHACKMLSKYGAESEIKNIAKNLNSKNKYLVCSAAMALSRLGDEIGVSQFILDSHDNFCVSYRFIARLFSDYSDNVKTLAEIVLGQCNDYTKAIVIKAIAKYNFKEFENIYIRSLRSENPALRVAAVTAIGNFAEAKYERIIIRAYSDKVWFVRNAAIKALGAMNTPEAMEVVSRGTSDPEWWVRYNAAKTLISMINGLNEAESILSGYDEYAADAVKYALYRDYVSADSDSNF